MIKKSLIIALGLLLAYEAFIRLAALKWDTSQNDKSANLISAQNFLYNTSKEAIANDTVIIGSSLSRKLITELLGKNYYNLAFNAWSSYDGLELVKLSGKKPACLLIETNVVGNQTLQEDVVNSLSPVSYYSNTMLKSLQLQNQPVGLVIGGIKEKLKAKMDEMKRKKRENQELYNYNLKLEKEKQMNVLPDSVYTQRFEVLKKLVDAFKAQNVAIVFFELPIDNELAQTNETLKNRKFYRQYFPETQYRYIAMPQQNNYIYSDGIHLSVQSAPEYTLYLKNEIQKIKSN